jgi:hypothetical protein
MSNEEFLKKFEVGGEFENCHGVISGNHTREALTLISQKYAQDPTIIDKTKRSLKQLVSRTVCISRS